LRGTLKKAEASTASHSRLVTRTSGYVLETAPDELDMNVFRERTAESRRIVDDDPRKAHTLLEEALGLWRGSPLQDISDGKICRGVALQLDEEYMTALEDKLWLGIGCADPLQVIGELKRMSAIHPWRERITEMLMLALYRCGRQAEAVEAYNKARGRLVDELGMEPSVQLRKRFRDILNQDPSLYQSALRSHPVRTP
jgi:DNA-binding SARP family transcriptional activator